MLQSRRDLREAIYTAEQIITLDEIVNGVVSPRRVRDLAIGLSNLLIDGSYLRSWNWLGMCGAPYVNANSLKITEFNSETHSPEMVALQDKFTVVASIFGIVGAFTLFDHNALNPELQVLDPTMVEATGTKFKVSKFLSASGMYAKGKAISRQAAISFLRNKRGAGHKIDWNINEKDIAKSYDVLASVYDPGVYKVGNRAIEMQIQLGTLNLVEEYIFVIATDFVYSEDTQEFLSQLNRRFPGHLDSL